MEDASTGTSTSIAIDLLSYRRRQGLLATMTARATVCIIGILFSLNEPRTVLLAFAVLFPTVALWIAVRRGRWLTLIGIVTAIFDGLVIASLPFLWYYTNEGTEALRLANMINDDVPLIGALVMIVFNSLALDPVLPLIVAGAALISRIAVFAYVADSGVLVTTSDWITANTTAAVHMVTCSINLVFIVFIAATIAILLRSARRTIYRAVYLERANSQLSRYFSPDVARHLTMMTESASMGQGQLVEATVLFSDIKGFTRLSEQLTPRQTMALLADYHEVMVAEIFKHGGTLDKFLGDGLMATFGTPTSRGNDADNAVQAALAMNRALSRFNAKRRKRDLSEIYHRIGIHYGPVVAGSVGTSQRLEYTVIGDTVNVASRVEAACKELNVNLLITESVRLQLDRRYDVESLGEVEVRGKTAPMRLYTVHASSSMEAESATHCE